jgi:hypothetical protein
MGLFMGAIVFFFFAVMLCPILAYNIILKERGE